MNIVGLGFIFGVIMGVKFGMVFYLWIVLGIIFVGVVYDYLFGMFFIWYDGESLLEIIGCYLGFFIK